MRMLALLMCVLLLSCGKDKPAETPPPADLIPEEKMVQVLTEVHLLEAALHLRSPQPKPRQGVPGLPGNVNDPSLADVKQPTTDSLGYYNIFPKLGVTKKQYLSSMKWYCTHPEKMDALYDEVIIELSKRQTQEQAKGK